MVGARPSAWTQNVNAVRSTALCTKPTTRIISAAIQAPRQETIAPVHAATASTGRMPPALRPGRITGASQLSVTA
ncbi:hypothetical protein [Mycolicibacterium houstonense]|uniref:hypothetical protein n=1 Tax=Mycolicibacterium houstonense TaxID=146021 RepID=UPI00082D6F0E|nr:hypothetical protein [Mycolicibacterium houstonense]